jgi:hypothetical protein
VRILADFVLKQRKQMSFSDGANTWGFVLRRRAAGGWLIDSDGMG